MRKLANASVTGKRRKYEEAVGRNPLQHVDLLILVSATKFQRVLAANPAQRPGVIKDIFVGVARAGDWITNIGIATHLDEWQPDGDIETRFVLEPNA